jgi:hypothetical protein
MVHLRRFSRWGVSFEVKVVLVSCAASCLFVFVSGGCRWFDIEVPSANKCLLLSLDFLYHVDLSVGCIDFVEEDVVAVGVALSRSLPNFD